MMKRPFFLAFGGLIASLAITAPCHAGSTSVTTTGAFALTPAGAKATAWDFVYSDSLGNPLASLTSVSVINTGTLAGLSFVAGASDIKFSFTATNQTDGSVSPLTAGLQFTFKTTNAPGNVFLVGNPLTFKGATDVNSHAAITMSSVPEPASLALLGIGMTGFLAFRRYFKRTAIA